MTEFGEDGLIDMVLCYEEKLKNGGLDHKKAPPGGGEVEPEKLTMDIDNTYNHLDDAHDDDDDNDAAATTTTRREKLATAFFLRMKLRRRLLNRLARRLHRVAHVMDSGSRNVDAPAPPQYGDQMRRFVKYDEDGNPVIMVEGARNIREGEVEELMEKERERMGVKCTLEERRLERTATATTAAATMIESDDDDDKDDYDDAMMDVDDDTPTLPPVEMLLKHDEEDKPLLDKLAEYEVGYDKVYILGKPTPPTLSSPSKKSKAAKNNDGDNDKKEEGKKEGATPDQKKDTDNSTPAKEGEDNNNNKEVVTISLPIVDTVDTHEIGEETKDTQHNISRVPYSLNGRAPPPMDKASEWKRWTKEICDRIPDQVTFDDLGVGGDGFIFELEARLESAKRKAGGGGGGADVALNRGKGKVLRRSEEPEEKKSESEGDGDVNMTDADEDEGKAQADKKETADEKKEKELTAKNLKPFSVKPVPSFYHQDLQRVKIIQSELVRFSNIYETREILHMAQHNYDTAYNASMQLQQRRAQVTQDMGKMTHKHQYDLAGLQQQRKHQIDQARAHWERRQWQHQEMKKEYGEEGALVRSTCNDVLLEVKDRLEVRFAHLGPGNGSGETNKAAFLAKQVGNDEKEEVANVLGQIVHCVDRRYLDMLHDHPESFIPPVIANENTVIANVLTGETLAEVQKRESTGLKAQLEKIDSDFKVAETKRTTAWTALSKAKAEVGGASTTATKPRKSAPARQSHPTQQQRYQQHAMQAQRAGQVLVQGPAGPIYVSPAQYQQMQIQQQQQQMQRQQQMIADHTARMFQAQVAQQQQQQQNAVQVVAPTQAVPTQVHVVPVQAAAVNGEGDVSPLAEGGEPKKLTQNERYGYGDRYSSANVEARKNSDGTVYPVQQPKLMPNGEFARPAGRQRRGMDWDARRGCWFPVPEGQGEN